MIHVVVLGAGAGGGFPQWNSNAPNCNRARAGDPMAPSCTQTSIAVSADGTTWFVLNAAPDLRTQIERTPELHPTGALRSTPIAGVVLCGAEVDAITGLLTLREAEPFALYASSGVHQRIDANPIFAVLQPALVKREILTPGQPHPLAPSTLTVTTLSVPGKIPLYAETTSAALEDATEGLDITDGTARLLFIPGCAHVTDQLLEAIDGADCIFFDATLWQDDEMQRAGLGPKTGARMGHMSVSGHNGVIARLAHVSIRKRVLIHINNSNPLLIRNSDEYRLAAQAGWDVAHDGMRFTL